MTGNKLEHCFQKFGGQEDHGCSKAGDSRRHHESLSVTIGELAKFREVHQIVWPKFDLSTYGNACVPEVSKF